MMQQQQQPQPHLPVHPSKLVLNNVDQQELNYLQQRSYEAGSPGRNQWQMNLQGVGENNYSDTCPMADWDHIAGRLHPESNATAYGDFSDTMNSGLSNDMYMLDNLHGHGTTNSNSLQYAYNDGYLFPHLMEESMLYV